MFRKYKGCVGGIREIDCLQNKPYFGTVSLDRFLRIYNLNKQAPIQKMYLKSQLNCILLTKDFDPCESLLEEEKIKQLEAAKADKQKPDVIKRNTSGEKEEEGDEFWTKLKIIKSSEKSKGKKKSSTNIQNNGPVKKKRHE